MANITLLGASYTDVPAVDLPQTGGGTVRFYENGGGSRAAEDAPLIDGWWIGSDGVAEEDNEISATDYIDLDGVTAISYAGRMGSSRCVFWYDDNKDFISSSLSLDDTTAWYENILVYKPSGAAFVRCQSKMMSAENPPDTTPSVTVYYNPNYIEDILSDLVGDGVTDDSLTLQKAVNMCESVVLPPRLSCLISQPILVKLGYAKIIDGNGTNIIVDDDFYALRVGGSLNTAADATSMDAYVVANESTAIIRNLRITSATGDEGGGIDITKAFGLKLCDNYIHHVGNGIRFTGMCRDISISGNHIFAIIGSGLLFDQNVNLHQCNIVNNLLMFAHDCININEPYAVANFQIVGNDIEIDQFPSTTYATAKCIRFVCTSSVDMFGEIEISGNTLQGHSVSSYIIYLEGVSSVPISNLNITGNHISNSEGSAIQMTNCRNLSISGNTLASVERYQYELAGNCENISITGDTARGNIGSGGRIHAASTAVLSHIICKACICTPYGNDSIETSNVSYIDISDTIPTATTQANGLMSSIDKGRLDDLYADYSSAFTALGVN